MKRVLKTLLIALIATSMISIMAPTGSVSAQDGRWVDFGIFNGNVRCESRGDGQATNRFSGADGFHQFIQSTWDSTAKRRNRPNLIGRRPSDFTAAQQLKQAIDLERTYGINQWAYPCNRGIRDGSGPVWVTNEKLPKKPKRCAKRLRKKHGRKKSVADSVCGVGL